MKKRLFATVMAVILLLSMPTTVFAGPGPSWPPPILGRPRVNATEICFTTVINSLSDCTAYDNDTASDETP